ncbi:MAG: hypothetical protein ACLGH3_09440 [Actinomycetota bacterium]
MRRILLAAMAVLMAMGSAQADTRTETKLYTQLAGDAIVLQCDASDPDLGGLGGACFDLIGDETSVQITIEDVSGLPVGGYWDLSDAIGLDGNSLANGSFCGSTADIEVPDGAFSLAVYVDAALGPIDCLGTSPGVGLQGEIIVTSTVPGN